MTATPLTVQAVEAVLAWRRQHGVATPAAPSGECPKLRAARHEIGHLRTRLELLATQEQNERRRAEDAEAERESLRRTLENTCVQLAAANASAARAGRRIAAVRGLTITQPGHADEQGRLVGIIVRFDVLADALGTA